RVGTMPRAVDELMRKDNVGRLVVLFHRSDRARGEDRVHAEELHAENIRAVVHLGRREAMAVAMTREERDARAPCWSINLADDERIGRIAERRFDCALFDHGEAFHRVKAGAPYDSDIDADADVSHTLKFLTDSSIAARMRSANSTAASPSSPATIGRVRVSTQCENESSSARSGSFFSPLVVVGGIAAFAMRQPFTPCALVSTEQ